MGNTIDITNSTDCEVKIIVSPSLDFAFSDLLIGASSISTDKYGVINTIHDLWKVWTDMILYEDDDCLSDLAIKVNELFDSYGMPIGAGKMCNMYDGAVTESLDRISPAAWEAFRGVFELTITVRMKERNGKVKLVQYQSMTDYSWKVHNKYIARIKHGTLWEDGINLKEFKPIK